VSLIFSENVLKKRSETKVIIGEKNSWKILNVLKLKSQQIKLNIYRVN
jgi:hypothetical protein